VTDRALQDLVIRALADAPFRRSAAWRDRGLAEPERVERFARFLARHFYHERIVHFFKYSRALARVTGRPPETVPGLPAFDALLPALVLGSRESARAVAGLVVRFVKSGDRPPLLAQPIAYHDDLLRYEETMMVVEAGPRTWREPATGETKGVGGGEWEAPEKVQGTALLDLSYDLPAVLPKLLRPWTVVPEAPARPVRLIVARSRHGRVAVATASDAIVSIMDLADGRKTLDDLARAAGLRPAELEATVHGLTELGAVRFSAGS
jgi:hypothetical protein